MQRPRGTNSGRGKGRRQGPEDRACGKNSEKSPAPVQVGWGEAGRQHGVGENGKGLPGGRPSRHQQGAWVFSPTGGLGKMEPATLERRARIFRKC